MPSFSPAQIRALIGGMGCELATPQCCCSLAMITSPAGGLFPAQKQGLSTETGLNPGSVLVPGAHHHFIA